MAAGEGETTINSFWSKASTGLKASVAALALVAVVGWGYGLNRASDVGALEEELAAAEDEQDGLRVDLEQSQAGLQEAQAGIQQAQAALQQTEAASGELSALQAQLAEARTQAEALEAQRAATVDALTAVQADVAAAGDELVQSRRETQAAERAHEAATNRMRGVSGTLVIKEASLDRVRTRLVDLFDVDRDLTDLSERLRSLRTEVAAAEASLEGASNRQNGVVGTLAIKSSHLDRVRDRLVEVYGFDRDLGDAEQRLDELAAQVAALEGRSEAAANRLQGLTGTLAIRQDRLSVARDALADMRQSITTARNERDRLAGELRAVETALMQTADGLRQTSNRLGGGQAEPAEPAPTVSQ